MSRRIAAAGILAILLAPHAVRAQQDRPDTRTPVQIADSIAIATHARTLVMGAHGDSARAARIYEWIGRNVAYDAPGYIAGRLGSMSAEAVWQRRAAVCEGFVTLFRRMAGEVGLRTEIVAGYAKGFDYRPGQRVRDTNHAWIALWLAGRWRLIDPTWAAGFVVNGEFRPHFSWSYFLTPPEALLLSHLPDDDRWQLVERRMRRREFERMPPVPRLLMDVGFAPTQLRAAGLQEGTPGFPLVGSVGSGVRVVRAPATGVLINDAPVSFEVVWPGAGDVAVVSGGEWTRLARDGQVFRGGTIVDGDVVQLVGRAVDSNEYQTLLHYRVR
jgi:hypothetical protein